MLFDELRIRDISLKNRITLSPMCQYSSDDGFAGEWHLVHLGSRAAGGAGLVMTEATAVEARGRISPADLGIWKDEHIPMLAGIARFIAERGAVAGMQLAHAGRKASTKIPWKGSGAVPQSDGGWKVIAPSAIPFSPQYPSPSAMSRSDIAEVTEAFAKAAKRALEAGFKVVEIHAAHGYLLHEFLSSLSNKREDEYGGSFENRIRFVREVIRAVRKEWPEGLPLFMRISATEWVDGGWEIEQSIELARAVRDEGVDLIDCSSGGNLAQAQIPAGPGYQTRFAERIRSEAGIATSAVGLITSPSQAEHVLRTGQADLVTLGRELLRDPYWPLRAAAELHAEVTWSNQYLRAKS
ncbi:MAG TPA: NADH:flavin oxidoreductase/NADH oxidase [Spirochaetia bacterium]|nr:NADH:flavin oxidoreductase/NADH oxidase [Spirochaetia bacterium]